MNIGILGGSFDPIHNGHIKIAASAKYYFNLDKIIFVPLNQPWLKKEKTHASNNRRLDMCKLAIEKYESFEVLDIDIKRGGITYMIDTIEDIKKNYDKHSSFSIIIGDDNLEDIEQWKDFNRLSELTDFIVAPRTNKNKKKGFNYLNVKHFEVSSSQIRRKIKKEENWASLVPEEIKKYIIEKKLYK
ncbi:MAG: nicotinate (nicotinamide) nucleotide adenylyltransferase [Flavobacteriales bacterium]|nr:nicotinate (nicotinamide) nucleotide adenylyltransferase [Flavobacteriales bacterium]|tara:strand:- start:1100 stop:1660 length:561 start_codon:yes stop_codon:yes gene_type:complete